jgi:nucleoside-diphosphate-sugar epimerase
MKTALIGHTGFLGSNLLEQTTFTDLYNSKNIADIHGKDYDLIVSAGNSSVMWKANLEPETDYNNIQYFIKTLKNVNAKRFVLISTIEVYDKPQNVNENTLIDESRLKPYGKHRYALEQFIADQFKTHTIVRMPNLYGSHLKKNFVYDLVHNNRLDLTHKDNIQQWYNLKNVWDDINIAVQHDLSLINFAVEPISCKELAQYTLEINFDNVTQNPPREYNMQTKYGSFYKRNGNYLYSKKESLEDLKTFIKNEQSLL